MKTKRNDRVAKIAFTLLVIVALFFSMGAGLQDSEVICKAIEKYDGLKVVAAVLNIENSEAVDATTVSTKIEKEEVKQDIEIQPINVVKEVEEVEEEVKEETTITAVATSTKVETKAEEPKQEVVKEEKVEEPVATTTEVAEVKEEVVAEPVVEEVKEEVVVEESVVEEVVVEEPTVEEVVEEEVVEEYVAPAVQNWSIGLPDGYMAGYTGISTDTLYNNLQGMIDAGYIVNYSNYFAGHNPGAMGHLAGIGVGSVVRVSYGDGAYYDYTIVDHTTGSGSFADVNFPSYGNLWDIVQKGSGIVIQFCRDGSNNFFYGV